MATKTVATLSGTGYFERAHDAGMASTGPFYLAFFYRPTAGFENSFILAKGNATSLHSFYLTCLAGSLRWNVYQTSLINSLVVGPTLSAGTWYFVEAWYASGQIGVSATPVGSPLTSYSTGSLASFNVVNAPLCLGSSPIGPATSGDFHSFVYANALPDNGDLFSRERLYNEGSGRSYWEIDDSLFREQIIGAWDLSESSGTRFDYSPNARNFTNNGTVSSGTRTYTPKADSCVYGPVRLLASLLSQCPAFQAFVRVPTQSQALAKIYFTETEMIESANPRPWAIIAPDESNTEDLTGPFSSGNCTILLEAPVPTVNNEPVDSLENRTLFMNFVGKIVEEMQVRERLGGNIVCSSIAVPEPLMISNLKETSVPRYYSSGVRVSWGLGGGA